MKEKNKLMSGAERLRRAQAKAKADEEKRELKRKKSNQETLAEWSSKDGKPVMGLKTQKRLENRQAQIEAELAKKRNLL